MRKVICVSIVSLLAMAYSSFAFSESLSDFQKEIMLEINGKNDHSGTDDLILAVEFDGEYLSNGLYVNNIENNLYYPLSEIFSMFQFPIFVSPKERRVDGWFVSPGRTFELDVDSGVLKIGGERLFHEKKSVHVDALDIYATRDAIESWFPLVLKIDEVSQTLKINSSEELPIEKAKKRAAAHSSIENNTKVFESNLERIIPSYKIADWPAMSFRFGGSVVRSSRPAFDYGINLYGDFIGLNGLLFFEGESRKGINSAYLSLGRRDLTRSMFGPLKLAEIELGDVGVNISNLIGGSISGRGFRLSNRPLHQLYDFNKTTLRGFLKSKFEAELYVNDRLVDVFREDGSGQYFFEDINLAIGANETKIILYGPNGEMDEIKENIYVGERENSVSELYFDFSLLDKANSVFSNYISDTSSDLVETTVALNASIGVGAGFALSASIVKEEEQAAFLLGSLEKKFGGMYLRYSAGFDQKRVTAHTLDMFTKSRIYSHTLGLVYKSKGYLPMGSDPTKAPSEEYNLNYSISKSYDYRSHKSSLAWRAGFSVAGDFSVAENLNAHASIDKVFSNVHSVFDIQLNKDFVNDKTTSGGGVRLRSSSKGSKRLSKTFDLVYKILPKFEVVSIGVGAGYRVENGYKLNGRLGYDASEGLLSSSIGTSFEYNTLDVDLTAYYRESGSFGVKAGVEFSLLKYPNRQFPQLRKYNAAASSRSAILTFVDSNANGSRDFGEQTVSDVGVLHNGLPTNARTDFYGLAVIEGLAVDVPHDLSVMPSTVTNPNLRASTPEFAVVPRPGLLPVVELPLVQTGDIEGYITFLSEGKEYGVPNVQIVLENVSTRKLVQVNSEFDGLYVAAGLVLGEYEVSIDQSYLDAVGLISIPSKLVVSIKQGNNYWSGIDFGLAREGLKSSIIH